MNGIQPIHFTHFKPSAPQPLLGAHSMVVWVLNVITAGIYGSAECLEKQYRIRELTLQQADMQQQVSTLLKEWAAIELKITRIGNAIKDLDGKEHQKVQSYSQKLQDIVKPEIDRENARLKAKEIKSEEVYAARISEVVLDTISFLGLFLANLMTAGLYGVYQYNSLTNRVKVLTEKNDFIREQVNSLNDEKEIAIEQQLKVLNKNLDLLEEKYHPDHEEASQAYEEARQATQEMEQWRRKQVGLQRDLTALQTQQTALKAAEQKANQDYTQTVAPELDKYQLENQKLTTERDNVKAERDRLLTEKNARDREIADLRRQVNNIRPTQSDQELQNQVSKLKAKYRKLPVEQKLQAKLGPVPPKYTKRAEDGGLPGAIFDALATEDELDRNAFEKLDDTKKAAFIAYKNRYHDGKLEHYDKIQKTIVVDDDSTHYTAASIVETGFAYVFQKIMEQANKFKLTTSQQTKDTAGAQAVYRYLVWDLLSGAKLHHPGCHGFELRINLGLNMYPSKAEKVLQYEIDSEGKRKPVVVLRYERKDDFTPAPEQLKNEHGVDAVSAKWIIEQLSDKEREILLNLLMAPLMENTHPDYLAAVDFISNKDDPRVKLIKTGYELICDLANAFDIQFKDTVFARCWQTHANDATVQPFEKVDNLKVIEDVQVVAEEEEVKTQKIQIGDPNEPINWKINRDVLGDKRGTRYTQEEFIKLIENAKSQFEDMNVCMREELLTFTHEKDTTFDQLEWEDIEDQYHISHQILAQNDVFGNLMATLLNDKTLVTEENAWRLKRAMATFLDTPSHAQAFEKLIQETYNCTVVEYQTLLRGLNPSLLNKAGLLEIQLAAYALGVRIGVLSVGEDTEVKIDQYGKIVPESDYYGPHTNVVLLMAKDQNKFYGLFPKLNLNKNLALEDLIDNGLFNFVTKLGDVHTYWSQIGIQPV